MFLDICFLGFFENLILLFSGVIFNVIICIFWVFILKFFVDYFLGFYFKRLLYKMEAKLVELFAWSYVLLWECFACLVAEKMEGKVGNFLKIGSFDFGVLLSNFSFEFVVVEKMYEKKETFCFDYELKWLKCCHWIIFWGFSLKCFLFVAKTKNWSFNLVCSSLCCFLRVHIMHLNFGLIEFLFTICLSFLIQAFFLFLVFCLFVACLVAWVREKMQDLLPLHFTRPIYLLYLFEEPFNCSEHLRKLKKL